MNLEEHLHDAHDIPIKLIGLFSQIGGEPVLMEAHSALHQHEESPQHTHIIRPDGE